VQVNIKNLIDDVQCYQTVRDLRWPDGAKCAACQSKQVIKRGFDDTEPARQRYECSDCHKRFDDLTDTIFARHHQPLTVWVLCLYFMGLNLSNEQIAHELAVNVSDVQQMTTQLREGVVKKKPTVTLSNEVECDEAYVVAGHKGQPEVVKEKARKGRRRRFKGKGGRGTLEKERPPVFGMIQRGGQVVINLLANVKQKTIEPFIKETIDLGTLVYTDEYSIYARLSTWGYDHKRVNHGRGEYARDEDGDGYCEVHVNTMEGFWSLLRSWLRPHRGISQEKLPLYLGFFEFVHNARKRGKALLSALIELLVK
jgi:transposase-like protein